MLAAMVCALQVASPETLLIRAIERPPPPLLRSSDTVFVAASIPDSTPFWDDDFVDFQVYFCRVLDSSVVFRGRNGRWGPPRDDPDWRLGSDRIEGGWEVSAGDGAWGWNLLLRMDPAWSAGEGGQLPRIAFRIYDDEPSGWYAWPTPEWQRAGYYSRSNPVFLGFRPVNHQVRGKVQCTSSLNYGVADV